MFFPHGDEDVILNLIRVQGVHKIPMTGLLNKPAHVLEHGESIPEQQVINVFHQLRKCRKGSERTKYRSSASTAHLITK